MDKYNGIMRNKTIDSNKIVENAKKFCEHIDCEMNEHGQYIYISKNGASHINLPYILLEYLEWLEDKKIKLEL